MKTHRLAAIAAGLRQNRRRPNEDPPVAVPLQPASAPETVERSARVAGYVTVGSDQPKRGPLNDVARRLADQCGRRGLELATLVHDVEPQGSRLNARPGLAHILDRISHGELEGIVAPRLRDFGSSAVGLATLLRWLEQAGARAVALDLDLDTSTDAGAYAACVLMEIGEWERNRIASRTASGLAAARSGPNALPGVRDDPRLAARIVAMRMDGMSLQAIADALNEAGVPTLRGGREWRPSSVQVATGYKRPAQEKRGIEIPRPRPVGEREEERRRRA